MPDKGSAKGNGEHAEPPIPPKGERLHVATYARDKKNPGGYLIRIEGPTAAAFAGRKVPVVRKDHSESVETLTVCIWAGNDQETGKPVALYRFEQRERDDNADDLPF